MLKVVNLDIRYFRQHSVQKETKCLYLPSDQPRHTSIHITIFSLYIRIISKQKERGCSRSTERYLECNTNRGMEEEMGREGIEK